MAKRASGAKGSRGGKGAGKSGSPSTDPSTVPIDGSWRLEAYAFVEEMIYGAQPERGAQDNWLFAQGNEGIADLKKQTGMELSIQADGSFSELKTDRKVSVVWYDSEGVEVAAPEATKGRLKAIKGHNGYFLHPSDAPSWMPRSRESDQDALRYDDGDTLICDIVRPEGDKLIRVMSAITDGMYLSRVLARYKRIS